MRAACCTAERRPLPDGRLAASCCSLPLPGAGLRPPFAAIRREQLGFLLRQHPTGRADRVCAPRCGRAPAGDARRGSPRGGPTAEPRAPASHRTLPAACSADSRAARPRTSPAPRTPHRSARRGAAAGSHRSASAPAIRPPKRRNRRSRPPRRLRARAAAGRFPRIARRAAPIPSHRRPPRDLPRAHATTAFRPATGRAFERPCNLPRAAPTLPPPARVPAAPPASPFPARRRRGDRRRSGACPSRNPAGSTPQVARAPAAARAP